MSEADRRQEPGEGTGPAGGRALMAIVVFVALVGGLVVFDPSGAYLWIKALHVISVIAWMAGMFYLPRLFVYHCDAEPGSRQSETFKVMERRLLRVIITPAMIATWAFGLVLIYLLYPIPGYWIWVKLAAVLAMSGLHGGFSRAVKDFAADRNVRSPRYWRLMNEVPTLLLVVIVVMVIVRPF